MYGITHLLAKHRKEMSKLDKDLKKEQRRRKLKEKQMEKMVDNALRANNSSSVKGLPSKTGISSKPTGVGLIMNPSFSALAFNSSIVFLR